MPRKRTTTTELPPRTSGDLVGDLITELNKSATSSGAYLDGDHAQHTWGIKIPSIAFQWVIGGSDVLPCQRYLGLSGAGKSFKSTLMTEIGNWVIEQNGIHIILDTENKTSPSMLSAQSWWNGIGELNRRVYKVCASVAEWQTMVIKAVEKLRADGYRTPGTRIPLLLDVDSLVARGTEAADAALRAEGFAPERGYPVVANQVTNYLENLNLLGTTAIMGWVQHMKASLDQTGYGTTYKEKGPTASQFHNSIHLRVTKGSSFRNAKHPSAPFPEYPVEGHDIWLRTAMSCLGPGDKSLRVQLCWQYVPDDNGVRRQVMWWDWDGALGNLLFEMKYNAKFKPTMFTEDKRQLDEALHFTGTAKALKCEELGLVDASAHELGKAIRENDEVRGRVSRFLGIQSFPSVQEAEIDFEAGNLVDRKKAKR